MQTSLRGINNKAKNDASHKFGGVYRLLNEENLRWSFYKLNKRSSAGVDGTVIRPDSGTPQGGIISPVLANIYLHYVLMV